MEILTNAHGVPFERPAKPERGASIEQKIAYMHALHAYNDAVAQCAHKEFTSAFRRAL